MLRILKYQIRGAVYAFMLASVLYGCLLYPHVTFKVTASNIPLAQIAAEDTSISLAQVMPQVKPKVK